MLCLNLGLRWKTVEDNVRSAIGADEIKKAKGDDIGYWLEYDAKIVEIATLVISGVLAIILAIVLIVSVIQYLP